MLCSPWKKFRPPGIPWLTGGPAPLCVYIHITVFVHAADLKVGPPSEYSSPPPLVPQNSYGPAAHRARLIVEVGAANIDAITQASCEAWCRVPYQHMPACLTREEIV